VSFLFYLRFKLENSIDRLDPSNFPAKWLTLVSTKRPMKAIILSFSFLFVFHSKAAWTNLNTGISDDLTGVVFWGNNGLLSGNEGLYYTTTGGIGAASWSHFTINGNPSDSITYSNSQFSHAFAYAAHTNYAFACGEDTVNDRGVIMQFFIPTQTYQILYVGATNTKLNNIHFSQASGQYFAVGDNGLIVRFNLSVNGVVEASGGALDYESVFFSSNKLTVGTNNYHTFGSDNNPGINLSSIAKPGVHLKDVWLYTTTSGYAVGDGLYMVSYPSGNVTPIFNYNFGPLNGNSIFKLGANYFIGTDHGIFRFSGIAAVEWQPSSMQHYIYDFWSPPLSTTLYACGKNGVLLSTTDNGGPSLPYMKVLEDGGCKGSLLTMSGTYGSATSCAWYLNGSLVSSSCANYSMLGNTTGSYQIKFIGTNSAGTDSAQTIFYVVDTPEINLPVMILDTMLCKKEPLVISIDQTENDVYYHLIPAAGGSAFGNSPAGNGGLISYTTDSVSTSGSYLLRANSSLAACTKKFTDTISIVVEHTKADFHVGITNLVPGEQTHLFETCTDASNYAWEFPAGSFYSASSLANPTNTFTNIGNQQIELLCWSDNFCYDSIIGPGPTVYSPPAVYDSCWVNQNSGFDPEWMGYYFYEISELSPISDGGYLISGTFHDHAFGSTYGDSLELDWFGSYLCKYDKNGVYKWNVHSVGAGNGYISAGSNVTKFSIKATAEDADGNIYGCGYFENYYVDNSGDTIFSPGGFGQIFKLDSLGKTIWQRNTEELYPYGIEVDYAGNIVVTSARKDQYYNGTPLYLNGVVTDTLPELTANFGITKFLANGDLVWDVPIQMNHTNFVQLLGVRFDASNNIYLTGSFEYNATIYSVGVTDAVTNTLIGTYGEKMLLAKFNPGGTLQWLVRSYTKNFFGAGGGGDSTRPLDMTTDSAGNCYISGGNEVISPNVNHYYENPDGSIDSLNGGIYFLMKVNKFGYCQWMNAPKYAFYGTAHEVELISDTLFVLGSHNAMTGNPTSFQNSDGSNVTIPLGTGDYFIGVYDTAGYMHRAFKNGNNGNVMPVEAFNGFHKGTDGNFYAARNDHQLSSTILNYVDFGHTITSVNNHEGWVTKFCEDCGITFNVNFEDVTDTTLCTGASYTFPDGTMLTNILTDVHDTIIYNSIISIDSLVITNIYVNGYPNLSESASICYNEDYTFPDGTTLTNITALTTYSSVFQTTLGCDSIITTVITPIPQIINPIDSVSVCSGSSYIFMDGFTANNITSQTSHDIYYTSIQGCDSIIQTIVYPLPAINSMITVGFNELISNYPQGSDYYHQWLDCQSGYYPLLGETNASYTSVLDGIYAVVVTDLNGCADTSACELFDFNGLEENTSGITVYPNPTNGQIYIAFDHVNEFSSIRVLDALGQEVEVISMLNASMIINLPHANGIYYLQFISSSGQSFTRVISQM